MTKSLQALVALMLSCLVVMSCGVSGQDDTSGILWADLVGDYATQCGVVDSTGAVTLSESGTMRLIARTTEIALLTIGCDAEVEYELIFLGTRGDTIQMVGLGGSSVLATYLSSQSQLTVTYDIDKAAVGTN